MNTANQILFFNNTETRLMTIHNYGIRLWTCDLINKKIQYQDVNLGSIKRMFTCAIIDPTDQFAILGTKTGDVVEVSIDKAFYKRIGPAKTLFQQGVHVITLLANGDIMVGAGDGTVAKIGFKDFVVKSS